MGNGWNSLSQDIKGKGGGAMWYDGNCRDGMNSVSVCWVCDALRYPGLMFDRPLETWSRTQENLAFPEQVNLRFTSM